MIGYFCAMRVSELQLCHLDCIKNDSHGNWFITFWRKKSKDYHTLPIERDIAKIIQQQQEYIKKILSNDFDCLFCDYLGTRSKQLILSALQHINPVKRIADIKLLNRCINCLIKSEDIRDENGKLWQFNTHQLRDTRLTYLFETGHELAVVSNWAGHKKQEMTQKYVHVKDHTIRESTASIQITLLNIKGEPVNPLDLPKTFQQNPNAHTLSYEDHINTPIYGYCGLPLNEDCPHWRACYTCPSFVARRELLPDYIRICNQRARKANQGRTKRRDRQSGYRSLRHW